MELWNNFMAYCSGWSTGSIAIRLVLATVIGIIIGLDRGLKKRGAGLKTHTLVCVSSALVMLTGQFIFITTGGSNYIDRLPAQVISGVGFLGVGTIIVTGRNQIKGLTTAATLWACACLGLAIGIGFIDGTIIAFALTLFILKVLVHLEELANRHCKVLDLYVEFESKKSPNVFIEEMRVNDIKIQHFDLNKGKTKNEGPNAWISLVVKKANEKADLLQSIRTKEYIHYLEEM